MNKAWPIVLPLGVILLLLVMIKLILPGDAASTTQGERSMVKNGVDFSDGKAVEVIDYEGDYILVRALRIGESHPRHADGPGCPLQHWHADEEVTAVNTGKVMGDPFSGGCGFGTLQERPIANYFPHELLAD